MFTGIVQGIAQIYAIKDSDNFRTQIVKLPAEMRKGLEIGASVANNARNLAYHQSRQLKSRGFCEYRTRNANGR